MSPKNLKFQTFLEKPKDLITDAGPAWSLPVDCCCQSPPVDICSHTYVVSTSYVLVCAKPFVLLQVPNNSKREHCDCTHLIDLKLKKLRPREVNSGLVSSSQALTLGHWALQPSTGSTDGSSVSPHSWVAAAGARSVLWLFRGFVFKLLRTEPVSCSVGGFVAQHWPCECGAYVHGAGAEEGGADLPHFLPGAGALALFRARCLPMGWC